MFEIVSSLLKYAFTIVIYLFILNIIRLILLDIRSMGEKSEQNGFFRYYLKLVSVQGIPDYRVEGIYPLAGDTSIGRSPESTICIGDSFLSISHAILVKKRKAFCLKDNDSMNGTYLNGRRLGVKPVRLKDGDKIVLGRTEFLFVEWGTPLVLFLVFSLMIYILESDLRIFLLNALVAITAGTVGTVFIEHIRVRVEAWINPWKDISGKGYLSNRYDGHAIMDIVAKIEGYEPAGADLSLTIDNDLQTKAEKLMRNLKGAVVVMNPKTGEILAMVSKPDFNPNSSKLESKWKTLVESPDAPFMPRATLGMYAPGSTFKVVISAAAIENGMSGMKFKDNGVTTIDGKEFRNAGGEAYGELDLEGAPVVSSNAFFATLGADLGFKNLKDASMSFGLQKNIPFELPVNMSSFPYKEMSKTDMASVGIGQGKILVTPLQMALIASCIANDGVMMKPWLVKGVKTVTGITLHEGLPSELFRSVSQDTAVAVKDMMVGVVENGTGKNSRINGISVAGKTGTAQNESTEEGKGKEHAWFIGFAPADDPVVAVAVIAEFSGSSGGSLCAPIARELMKACLGTN